MATTRISCQDCDANIWRLYRGGVVICVNCYATFSLENDAGWVSGIKLSAD